MVVVGESPYAESAGDSKNPALGTADVQTIENVKKLGIPYVVLLLSGRPLMLGTELDDATSVVACWLPGTEGEGIADVLFGDDDFTGKLSQTWPTSIAQEPTNWGDGYYQPLFPYGYGLTYGVTGVNAEEQPSFGIYPNPATDFIHIPGATGGTLEIFDLFGRCELKETLEKSGERINIKGLPTGMFLVRMTSRSGNVSVSRFVKRIM